MTETTETSTAETTASHANVVIPNFDNTMDKYQYKFNFKKDDLGNKRPSVELVLPVPSVEGIVKILEVGGKQLELLQEAVAAVVLQQARVLVNEKEDVTQENFPFDKISWEFISNIAPKERKGGGIASEVWEAFAKDYVEVMPAVTGKTAEQVGNAAKVLLNKFSGSFKTNKPAIELLKGQLAIYIANTQRAEEFAECVDFLVTKADNLLNQTDEDLLKNL